jgi:hypothetical protein
MRAEAGGTVTRLPVRKAMILLLTGGEKICKTWALCRMIIDGYSHEPATEREFLCLVSDVVRGGDPRHLPSISHVALPLHFLTDLLPHGKPMHA